MLQQDSINNIVNRIQAMTEKSVLPEHGKSEDEKIIEKFGAVYYETVEHTRELRVHADGLFPSKLIKERAPNEAPEEYDYRKRNYQPVTKSVWGDALKILNRKWNRSNYSVKWEDEEQQKYFEEDFPLYGSIYHYCESIVDPMKVKDPNAVLYIIPREIPTTQRNGEMVVDQSAMIEPMPNIAGSPRVWMYHSDLFALIKLEGHTKLTDDNPGEATGYKFLLIDDEKYYEIRQVGKKHERKYEIVEFYAHELGYVPAWRLGGTPIEFHNELLFKSYFDPALPDLNNAVIDASTLQVSKHKQAFPYEWIMVEECNNPDCNDGWLDELDDKQRPLKCPNCKGTGKQNASPLGRQEYKLPENNDEFFLQPPYRGFTAPDSQILEFLRTEIERCKQNAFVFISPKDSQSNAKGGETALGKIIDREDQFAFLSKDANEMFRLLSEMIDAIGTMRYMGAWEMPVIIPPINFKIRNESEITEEINMARASNAPDIIIRKLTKEAAGKRFGSDPETRLINDIALRVDRLATKTDIDINAGLAVGKIAKWEAVLHDSISTFIDEFILENDKWLELDYSEQREQLISKAKQYTLDELSAPPIQNRFTNIDEI